MQRRFSSAVEHIFSNPDIISGLLQKYGPFVLAAGGLIYEAGQVRSMTHQTAAGLKEQREALNSAQKEFNAGLGGMREDFHQTLATNSKNTNDAIRSTSEPIHAALRDVCGQLGEVKALLQKKDTN